MNAVLILIAAGAVTFGVGFVIVSELGNRSALQREAQAGADVTGPQADPRLTLENASSVAGTSVMRAQLTLSRGGSGFSSGGYDKETRNILFIEPGNRNARWLLPDNQRIVTDSSDLFADENDQTRRHIVATAVLIKPAANDLDMAKGRLILFNADGKTIVEGSDGVRRIHVATLKSDVISILYERDRRLVSARYDATSLLKRDEQEIDVPQLK